MRDTDMTTQPMKPAQWGELEKDLDGIPHLKERMLVDLVNGLEVSSAQIEYKGGQGLLSRVFGFLDGSGRRRELMIQQQTQRSLEALTNWTLDLTEEISATHRAMEKVARFTKEFRDDLLKVAKTVLRHGESIAALENRFVSMENRLDRALAELDARIHRLEIRQHITEVTEGWRSGRFCGQYPPVVGALFLVDGLIRGEIGAYILEDGKALDYLEDRIVNILHEKMAATRNLQPLDRFWLSDIRSLPLPRRLLLAYGANPPVSNWSLHRSVSETADFEETPTWLEKAQDDGFLPVLLDAEVWTDRLIREAKDHWKIEMRSEG